MCKNQLGHPFRHALLLLNSWRIYWSVITKNPPRINPDGPFYLTIWRTAAILDFKIEILRHPTEEDWMWCKICTLNTISKTTTTLPSNEWKVKLLKSEHSPLRELWFGIKMTIPYYVSVHFVRHHIGVNHYVSTQRDDRVFRDEEISRADLPQGQMVTHIMSVNAQELMFMARKRLCKQAEELTRKVLKAIVNEVHTTNPEFKEANVLVPNCVYRNGKCDEFFPCDKGGEPDE